MAGQSDAAEDSASMMKRFREESDAQVQRERDAHSAAVKGHAEETAELKKSVSQETLKRQAAERSAAEAAQQHKQELVDLEAKHAQQERKTQGQIAQLTRTVETLDAERKKDNAATKKMIEKEFAEFKTESADTIKRAVDESVGPAVAHAMRSTKAQPAPAFKGKIDLIRDADGRLVGAETNDAAGRKIGEIEISGSVGSGSGTSLRRKPIDWNRKSETN